MDNTEELLKSLEENIKKDAKRREPYVKALIKKLDIPKEKASSLVFDANEINYTTNEFALVRRDCFIYRGQIDKIRTLKPVGESFGFFCTQTKSCYFSPP